jgi:hypothetical protein
LSWLFAPKAKKATLITTLTMALLPSMKRVLLWLFSVVLLISYPKPIDLQHFKSTTESSMSVTTQMVNSAIAAMRDEANTTSNKWLTLEAWKTILYHYYDLDDELGFSMNILTRAVKLFGSVVDHKVRGGNSTRVHLRLKSFVKYDKDGQKAGTEKVRFLLLADSKTREPKEPTDMSGWIREQEKSNAVVDKTSTLFVGIRALPSFNDRATTPGSSLNGTDLNISELRKKNKKKIIAPSQDTAVDAAAIASTAAAENQTSQAAAEDQTSQVVTEDSTAAATDQTSQAATENSTKNRTSQAAAAAAEDQTSENSTAAATDPTSQAAAENSTAAPRPIPPRGYWDSPQARDLFQPRPEERVEACLQRRVELFNCVLNDWSRLNEVLEGGEDTVSRLTDCQRQRLTYKCLYLRLAYEKALFEMGSGVSWKKCTELALVETTRLGLSTFSRPRLLANMNQDFRSMELFSVAHGVSKGLPLKTRTAGR